MGTGNGKKKILLEINGYLGMFMGQILEEKKFTFFWELKTPHIFFKPFPPRRLDAYLPSYLVRACGGVFPLGGGNAFYFLFRSFPPLFFLSPFFSLLHGFPYLQASVWGRERDG